MLNLCLGRQVTEGTNRLTDEKGSSPTPPTQSSISSPTHVPGSYRMLQKYTIEYIQNYIIHNNFSF